MVVLVPLLLLLGVLISRWAKVYVLVPGTVLAWVVAVQLARISGFPVWQTVIAAFVCGAGLQLGYLAGAALLQPRLAPQRKRAVVYRR